MRRLCALVILLISIQGAGPAPAQAKLAYFLVQVHNESFVLAVLNERAVQDAIDCLEGRKRLIPTGEIAFGDGGFNTGWGWHLKPETVRFADMAMELCDGLPSHVGNITSSRFCPWSARIVQRLPDKS